MHSSIIAMLATASAVNAAVSYNVSTPYGSVPAACPAVGTYDSQGRYSCNPAHAYPNGQTCVAVNGCYYLQYPASSTYAAIPPPSTYSAVVPPPSSTYVAVVPPASSTYVAVPPASSTYVAVVPPKSSTYVAVVPPASSTYVAVVPPKSSTYSAVSPPQSSTPATQCPAVGTTDSQGRYSCNPAHAYPTGQTCVLVNGCYYLQYPKTTTTPAQPSTTKVVYTGGASSVTAFSGLTVLVGLVMFAL